MRLTSIKGSARGRDFALELHAPVTVVLGPTGAGKTTLLQAAQWAVSGQLATGGAPVVRPGDVHQAMAEGPDDTVTCEDTFEHDGATFTVERTLTPGPKRSASQSMRSTLTPEGAPLRAVEERVAQVLGRRASLDIGALLAMGPSDRRRALLDACGSGAEAWTPERVTGRLKHHIGAAVAEMMRHAAEGAEMPTPSVVLGVCGSFAVMPGEGTYEAVRRFATTAHEKKLDATRRHREADERIRGMSDHVGFEAGEVRRDVDELRVLRDEMQAEVLTIDAERREAEQSRSQASRLEREIARLEALPQAEALAATVATLDGRLAQLGDELAVARFDLDQASAQIQGPKDLAELLATLVDVRAELERAMAKAHGFEQTLGGGCCPVCRQSVGAEVLASFEQQHRAAKAWEASTLSDLETIQAEADEIHSAHLGRLETQRRDVARLEQAVRQLEQSIAADEAARHSASAGRAAAAIVRDSLDEARAELERAKAKTWSSDSEARASIAGGRLAKAAAGLEAALRDQGKIEEGNRLIDERDALAKAQASAVVSAQAWAAVGNEYGQSAVQPFTDAVARLLPESWSLGVDLASMDMTIARADRPGAGRVPVDALSRGETVMFLAAASAALAVVSGAPWRCAFVDHAEGLTDAVQDGEDGLLVLFVARLVDAVEAGLLDQAVVATGRLTGDERVGLTDYGAQVVNIGDLSRPAVIEVEVEPDEAAVESDAAAAVSTGVDGAYYRALRRAMRGVSGESIRSIVEGLGVVDAAALPKDANRRKGRARRGAAGAEVVP